MIPFNKPVFLGKELEYIKQSIDSGKLCGDGEFTKKCQMWMEKNLNAHKALLTTSGTAALEMSAFLTSIEPGVSFTRANLLCISDTFFSV